MLPPMLPDASKRNDSTKRRHKRSYRPKIRWELFGLPNSESISPSIETIRSAVSALAVTRFAREPIPDPKKQPTSMRKRRSKAWREGVPH